MRRTLMTILTIMVATMMGFAKNPWDFRGVVYDVGLRFTPESCSVDSLDTALVAYDMGVIANILRANAVRIEGEDVSRLVAATRIAHSRGLKVLFNPWKMNVGEDDVVTYASGTWEDVDWSLFDIVGVDYYRDRQTAEDYVNGIQRPLRLRVLLPHHALSPGGTRPRHDLVCHRENLSGG